MVADHDSRWLRMVADHGSQWLIIVADTGYLTMVDDGC